MIIAVAFLDCHFTVCRNDIKTSPQPPRLCFQSVPLFVGRFTGQITMKLKGSSISQGRTCKTLDFIKVWTDI